MGREAKVGYLVIRSTSLVPFVDLPIRPDERPSVRKLRPFRPSEHRSLVLNEHASDDGDDPIPFRYVDSPTEKKTRS